MFRTDKEVSEDSEAVLCLLGNSHELRSYLV